jgi:hypothetical protein
VPLLASLTAAERARIADAMETKVYTAGEPVLTQGRAAQVHPGFNAYGFIVCSCTLTMTSRFHNLVTILSCNEAPVSNVRFDMRLRPYS